MIDRLPELHRVVAAERNEEEHRESSSRNFFSGETSTAKLSHPDSPDDNSLALSGFPGSTAAATALRYSKALLCVGTASSPIGISKKTPSVSTAPSEAAPSSPIVAPSACSPYPPLSSFFPSPDPSTEVHGSPKDQTAGQERHITNDRSALPVNSPDISCSSETSADSMSDASESGPAFARKQRLEGSQRAPSLVGSEESDLSPDGDSSLFPFLRKAKALKIAINEVLLLQQQTGYLLLLHPPGAAAALQPYCCPGCTPNGGTGGISQATGDAGLCYNCELANNVHAAQQLLQRAHSALRQLQRQHEEDEQRHRAFQEAQQSQTGPFLKHMHMQQASAAFAAELRIRRSVIQQQQQQLTVALEQQQQLEQDLRVRWEGEVSAEMRILYPEASAADLQQAVQRIGDNTFEGDQTTLAVAATAAAAAGSTEAADLLAAKCRQLQRLGASLLEVQRMVEEMQRQQESRQQQLCSIAEAAACSKQNTAAAVHDMLLARKYQRRAYRHSLMMLGALVALFLFFFMPTSPILPLLFWLHGESPPPAPPVA
ncbi:putative transmembrane protein [Toxoplasma gondii RUB]|uniref:Putative transmembrane protein n=1 Tax=Toxoplasma gondii RUB TaxID=935652 RepID=A0A086LQS6_TOXGO|nr:putative transmembrane protein [Toxoplasma gondii RUB]